MELPENFFDIEFGKAVAFGYKTEDVDEFVTKAIDIMKQQQEEIEVLQEKLGVLASSVEKYRDEEDSLRSALIGAQKLGDSILKDSKSKAEVILRDATTQANHIIEDAHVRLEQEKAEYARLKTEVSNFRDKLISMYKIHIDQISRIPHQETAHPKQSGEAAAPEAPVQEAPTPEVPAEAPPKIKEIPVQEEPQEAPAPKRRAIERTPKPAIQLEMVDDEEEDYGEDDSILGSFNSKVNRIISPASTPKVLYSEEDFEEDEEEEIPAEKRPVVSSKFGVLKFGESFDLQGDEEVPRPRSRRDR